MDTGIIFDLDGTLLDTLEDLLDATNETLAHFGCPPRTLAQLRQMVGNGARHQMEAALPGTPADPDIGAVLDFYRAYYRSHCRIRTKPYPGIPALLKALGQRFPLAIVSNKPDGAVKALCADFFGPVYALGEHDGCPRKPAPDMVFQAMKAIGVNRCVYVGDSEVDLATARNAGCPCISVTWGFRDSEVLLRAGASVLCPQVQMLPQMIEETVRNFHGL